MAYLNDRVLDFGLNELTTNGNRLDITIGEAISYAEATTIGDGVGNRSAGNKTSLSIGAPADRTPTGRRVTIAAITDGVVTFTGTVSHWAVTDTVNERLLATGSLSASQAVTDGNVFTLTAADIGIPAPA